MHTVFLIIGKSGAGKDTVVKELCSRYGYKQLISYTTRQRRYEGENTHLFVSEDEYEAHKASGSIAGYTLYNEDHYFSTKGQLYENDLYVIDPAGVDYLKDRASNINLVGIYLDISKREQKRRMRKRGDKRRAIRKRIKNDKIAFANVDPSWYKIDASQDQEEILKKINKIVRKHLTDSNSCGILKTPTQ